MTRSIRFRGKNFNLIYFTADDQYGFQQGLTGETEEPGSYAIEFSLDPSDERSFTDIIIKHSVSDDEYPYQAIHGQHVDYGEIYMMSSVENGIIIYNGDTGVRPSKDVSYTGDGL
jgi:hypothetical protein